MRKKIPMPMDGKNATDDWIYDNLAEGNYVTNGDNKEIAFYRFGYLWKASWDENRLNLCLIDNRAQYVEVMEKMEKLIHEIADWGDKDEDYGLFCETRRARNGLNIFVSFYAQSYEEGE